MDGNASHPVIQSEPNKPLMGDASEGVVLEGPHGKLSISRDCIVDSTNHKEPMALCVLLNLQYNLYSYTLNQQIQ
jgi:hypothetical protein